MSSNELIYYRVVVKIEGEDAKGRIKYRKEQYIVQGISPTDVEVKINDHLTAVDFEVESISATKIMDIVTK